MSSSIWILNVMAVGGLFTCCENWSETVNGTGDFKNPFSTKHQTKCSSNVTWTQTKVTGSLFPPFSTNLGYLDF